MWSSVQKKKLLTPDSKTLKENLKGMDQPFSPGFVKLICKGKVSNWLWSYAESMLFFQHSESPYNCLVQMWFMFIKVAKSPSFPAETPLTHEHMEIFKGCHQQVAFFETNVFFLAQGKRRDHRVYIRTSWCLSVSASILSVFCFNRNGLVWNLMMISQPSNWNYHIWVTRLPSQTIAVSRKSLPALLISHSIRLWLYNMTVWMIRPASKPPQSVIMQRRAKCCFFTFVSSWSEHVTGLFTSMWASAEQEYTQWHVSA